jgi:putative transcriptional regulator
MNIHDMALNPSGFLADKLLVATPSLRDGCFDKTVIYIIAHNMHGAFGLIVNTPLNGLDMHSLLDELQIRHIDGLPAQPIYFGGPVDNNQGFILHTADAKYPGTLMQESGICFSAGIELLRDVGMGCGPQKMLLAMGCAGWSGGQLESELETGSWIIAPATEAILFDTHNDHKWSLAAASLGVDLTRLSATVGHA